MHSWMRPSYSSPNTSNSTKSSKACKTKKPNAKQRSLLFDSIQNQNWTYFFPFLRLQHEQNMQKYLKDLEKQGGYLCMEHSKILHQIEHINWHLGHAHPHVVATPIEHTHIFNKSCHSSATSLGKPPCANKAVIVSILHVVEAKNKCRQKWSNSLEKSFMLFIWRFKLPHLTVSALTFFIQL